MIRHACASASVLRVRVARASAQASFLLAEIFQLLCCALSSSKTSCIASFVMAQFWSSNVREIIECHMITCGSSCSFWLCLATG